MRVTNMHIDRYRAYCLTAKHKHNERDFNCNILKSQVVSLQTAHSRANAGVLLCDACIGSGVAFEAIKLLG